MAQSTPKRPVLLQLAYLELTLYSLQLLVGFALTLMIGSEWRNGRCASISLELLMASGIVAQMLQLLRWLVVNRPVQPIVLCGFALMLLVGALEPMLVAAITITVALSALLNTAAELASLRSDRKE